MFGILRVLIGFIIGLIIFICVFKFTKVKFRSWFSIILIVVLLITVLGFVPFENWVYNFKSAEEVYKYYSFSEDKAEIVIEGEQSDFVVGRKKDTSTFLIVPKTADGWKIGVSINTKRIVQKFFDGITVYVYHYKNTDDYFISIFDINGGELNLSDDYNTNFYSLKKINDFYGKTFVTYYAHISNFNSQYRIILNEGREKKILCFNE